MNRINSGDLQVQRTRSGYVAVLRVQGADGSTVGLVARCSDAEARELIAQGVGLEVGAFSFAKLAKTIGRAASSIAKNKVFKSFISAAQLLPPPISSVASAASGAAKVLAGMKRGDPAALKEWKRAAAQARANPASPISAGMNLAMDAHGEPVFRSRSQESMRSLVNEVLAELAPSGASR